MAISVRKARDYVFGHGTLFEQALFAYLFEDGPLQRVHQCLLCYKNEDNGWGHGLEHDIATPASHPAALEYLLGVNNITGLPVKEVLQGTPQWLESIQNADGALSNPAALMDYPLAPWWAEWGGQKTPDSIVGNLTRLGLATPQLTERTQKWVLENVTLEKIHENEWLFMAYHYVDYFLNVQDVPDGDAYRTATIQNVVASAENLPEKQYYVLLQFAPRPESILGMEIPDHLIQRSLDYVQDTQQEDGHWDDEHNLPQWFPAVTIYNLNALKNYGRL